MLDPRTADLLKKYVLAGSAAGAGVGVGTSVLNYLNYLKDKSARQAKDPSSDDDILYVDVPVKKANISSWPGVGGGMALAGGALSMVLANALVKRMYNKFKKKQLQGDLDEAQQMYWDVEGKQASVVPEVGKPMSIPETLASTPVALTLLAAIASGAVANKALSHYFPSRKSSVDPVKDLRPKQVKIRYVGGDEDGVKSASEKEIQAAMDFAVSTIWKGLPEDSSIIPDLIGAVATYGTEHVADSIRDYGWQATTHMIKGASYICDDDSSYLAICAINRDPSLAPVMAALLEAELNEELPFFHKVAYELDYQDSETLIKLASELADQTAADVIDRNTSSEEKEEGETKEDSYYLLNKILAEGKVKKQDKEEDIVDQALSGK